MPQTSLSLFDLAPGKVVCDRWEITRSYRQGGMSATFEVNDAEDGAVRELQVFPAALFGGLDQTADFAGVMEAWSAIDAPAVLSVDCVTTLEDGTLVLATAFPPERSLRDWLNDHERMSAEDVVALAGALLEGLGAIHAAGQVHGDIKPYTIHVEDGGAGPVLIDGGITPGLWSAKHLGDKTALIGTPYYAPVEQFGGESPDVQSDIYNLATVLFELVAGCVPWSGASFLDVFQAKLAKQPPTIAECAPGLELPDGLEEVIRGGLMTDRRERFSSAGEFSERLGAL
ncbi:MAG: serine/threonine-protein kinase [Planctomycetota bacterium]|jgi:serine/threonine-protein kinase|nr:serine/threonine-protein kinase [Planctomycetota bacterium]MDP6763209.1 serine/threonine-protein kinase [Planctomycetota bacterium]MDP6990582.1 serine/threonine-protein kinase [Planctomycetota bacterium]